MSKEKLLNAAYYALEAMKKSGADKCACRAASGEKTEFNIDGGEFSLMRTLFNESLSVEAYIGGKKGSSALNSLEKEDIDKAVADAVSAAQSGVADDAWDIAPETENQDFTDGALVFDKDRFFDRIEELKETIEKKYPTVMLEQLIADYATGYAVVVNSNGVEFTSQTGQYAIDLMYSAHEGEKASSFFGSGVCFTDLDRPIIELGSIDEDLKSITKQVDTIQVDGKFVGTVIMTPGMTGEFIDTALGNFASTRVLIDGTSVWKDKLGKQVADSRLNVEFAPYNEQIVCGERVTGDGFISEDFHAIKDGVLESFLLPLYGANKTGFPRAKNSSGAMVIPAGDKPLADMIAGTDKGLLVARFSGGEPGTNGDFSGVAKNSFLIENGKITGAVSETMINGNLADMLNNIVDISEERVADGGSVLPYISFGGITVSGK